MKTLLDQIFANAITRRRSNLDTADVLFRRTTNRYARKGTMSNNKSYLMVGRDDTTGQFISVNQASA